MNLLLFYQQIKSLSHWLFFNNKIVIQMLNKLYVEREQCNNDARNLHVTVWVLQYSRWSLAVHVQGFHDHNATAESYSPTKMPQPY